MFIHAITYNLQPITYNLTTLQSIPLAKKTVLQQPGGPRGPADILLLLESARNTVLTVAILQSPWGDFVRVSRKTCHARALCILRPRPQELYGGMHDLTYGPPPQPTKVIVTHEGHASHSTIGALYAASRRGERWPPPVGPRISGQCPRLWWTPRL